MTVDNLSPGNNYVVAVSGGVDSVVLLHKLMQATPPMHRLVVAHFDHGIRPDSRLDRIFVQDLAKSYSLPFEFEEGNLGPDASEAKARDARYAFLYRVQQKYAATAVITAHHQDDMLETAIINMLRGTNRRGISSLASTDTVRRPLLSYSKKSLIGYAKRHRLEWREDYSNADQRYLRNYVRHTILPKASNTNRAKMVEHINKLMRLNAEIDAGLEAYIHNDADYPSLNRDQFILLPHPVACEIVALWLRHAGVRSYDTRTLNRLVVGAKTLPIGSLVSIDKYHWLEIRGTSLALIPTDR